MRTHTHAYVRALFISTNQNVANISPWFSGVARWAPPRDHWANILLLTYGLQVFVFKEVATARPQFSGVARWAPPRICGSRLLLLAYGLQRKYRAAKSREQRPAAKESGARSGIRWSALALRPCLRAPKQSSGEQRPAAKETGARSGIRWSALALRPCLRAPKQSSREFGIRTPCGRSSLPCRALPRTPPIENREQAIRHGRPLGHPLVSPRPAPSRSFLARHRGLARFFAKSQLVLFLSAGALCCAAARWLGCRFMF